MIQFSRMAVAAGVATTIVGAAGAFAAERVASVDAGSQADQAVALVSAGVAPKAARDPSCPTAVVDSQAEQFPRSDDAFAARVEGLARDCANLGAETIVKIAVIGEGERDLKKKAPGQFDAPLQLTVKDAQGGSVETRRIALKVDMPDGIQKVAFRHLEENVSLPPAEGGYAGWTIVVGFEQGGPVELAKFEDKDAEPVAAPSPKTKRSSTSRKASRAGRRAVARRQAPPPAAPIVQSVQVVQPKVPEASPSPWQKVADSFDQRRANRQRAQPAQGQRPAAAQAPAAPQPAPRPQAAAAPAVPPLRTAGR
jgi:hypothetical protein